MAPKGYQGTVTLAKSFPHTGEIVIPLGCVGSIILSAGIPASLEGTAGNL